MLAPSRVFLAILVAISTAALIWVIFDAQKAPPKVGDVEISATLRAFAKAANPDIENVIPAFIELPGETGGIKDGHIAFVSEYYLKKDICAADLLKHVELLTTLANADEYDKSKHVPVVGFTKYLTEERAKEKSPDERRYCMLSNETGFSSDQIVKYKITTAATLKRESLVTAKAFGVMAGILFLALNFYYRGFVYVVCGPRRKSQSQPESAGA
jgi:hypothetical protein